jgi:tetratricopeptide (TPR) repeat protein
MSRPDAPLHPEGGAALPDGRTRDSLRAALAALYGAQTRGRPSEMAQTLAVVARAYRSLGALGAAVSHLEQALRWARVTGSPDFAVDLQCQLCELLVQHADALDAAHNGDGNAAREAARDHAFAASTLAHRVADADWEIKVLLRISDALERCGDHEDAASLQVRALQLMVGEPTGEMRLDAVATGAALRQ